MISIVYLTVPLFFAVTWILTRTEIGLRLRAVGENPEAADAAGINVSLYRLCAVLAGAALVGLAGGYLSVAVAKIWVDGMSGGRGWIAIALVIFARWYPWRGLAGALLFGVHRGADPADRGSRAAGAAILHADDAISRDHRRHDLDEPVRKGAVESSRARWAGRISARSGGEGRRSAQVGPDDRRVVPHLLRVPRAITLALVQHDDATAGVQDDVEVVVDQDDAAAAAIADADHRLHDRRDSA